MTKLIVAAIIVVAVVFGIVHIRNSKGKNGVTSTSQNSSQTSSDNSNSSLDKDMTSIDVQLKAVDQNSAQVDQSMNDKSITQTE